MSSDVTPPRRAGLDDGHPASDRLLRSALLQSRHLVAVGILGVLLIAMALFLLAAGLAFVSVWDAVVGVVSGELSSTDLKVLFLRVVTLVLKAVAFYIIGTGLYTLFIGPLPFGAGVRVESLTDLELKLISVIVVILASTFLEQFAEGGDPLAILRLGGALALVVFALVAFQFVLGREAEHDERRVDDATAPPADHVPASPDGGRAVDGREGRRLYELRTLGETHAHPRDHDARPDRRAARYDGGRDREAAGRAPDRRRARGAGRRPAARNRERGRPVPQGTGDPVLRREAADAVP
jgi:uncharacterized membrane protein YqhA